MNICACGRTEPHGHARELSLLKSAARTANDIRRMAAWKAGNAAGRRLLQAAFIKWRNRVAQAVIRGYSRGPLGPNVERTVENLTDWEILQAEGIAIFQPAIARITDTALTDKPLKMVKGQKLPLIAPATVASHNWSAKHSAKLVTEIMADTRLSINRLNRVAVLTGRSSQALARDIRPLIGLHSRQITALGNYRTKLEAAGMAPAKIDKLVAKKAQKALKYRSEMIARTETSFSRIEGLLIAHKEMGIPKLRWLADPECCATCAALSGKVYGIEQASGMIPKHPQCSCTWVAATQQDLEPGTAGWPYVGEPPISMPSVPKIPSPAQAPAPPPEEPIPGPAPPPEPMPPPETDPLDLIKELGLDDFTPAERKIIEDQLRDLMRQFPGTEVNYYGTTTSTGFKATRQMSESLKSDAIASLSRSPRTNGICYRHSRSVTIRKEYFSEAKTKSYKMSALTRWHFCGDSLDTIRHEFGHLVDKGRSISGSAGFQDAVKALQKKFGKNVMTGYARKYRDAASKWEEQFAEMFSAYTRGNTPRTITSLGPQAEADFKALMAKVLKEAGLRAASFE